MSIIINNPRAAPQMQQEAARRLQRTTIFFQQQLISRLSVSNPHPYLNSSKPGEFPRKRTGNLIANVMLSALDVPSIIADGMRVRAGLGQPGRYGAILEFFKQRLGFLGTVEELRPQLQAMLQGKAP